MAGADIRYIPYRTTPQATADLIGGRISMIWLSSLGNLAGSDAVRPFAVTLTGERWKQFPDVPTFDELGLKDYEATTWVSMYVPKDAPQEIAEKLTAAVNAALADPEVQTRFDKVGIVKPRAHRAGVPGKISERRNREVGRHPAHHQGHRLGASAASGFAAPRHEQKTNRVPGRAGGEFAPRHQPGLSGRRGGALRHLRGRVRRADGGRSRPRHDPDRELGGRPRRRHPSSDAELEAAHRRRVFHAGAAPVARRRRAPSSRTSRRSRATSMRSASAARSSASSASSRSSPPTPRARRARSPSAATRPARRSPRGSPPKSTASTSWPRTSRTRRTTPRASSCCRARRNGRRAARARSSPPSCSG